MTVSSSADARDVPLGREHFATQLSGAFLLVLVLTALRIATAVHLPLSFDEAYFWLWSKRLAISYFEHPPLIAFAIRAGTTLLGDTEFGVRMASLCASVAASWAVYRASAVIFEDRARAWRACAYFNATLMLASQGMAATPDIFVMAAAAFLLLTIVKLQQTRNGGWWIGIGAALGVALLAKYTAFFLGLSCFLWTVATPQGRRWLKSPWPYLAALVAVLCLIPNLVWNETHQWMSFRYQFGRVVAAHGGLRYALEFLGAQLALASPLILILAGVGLADNSRTAAWNRPIAIAVALVWPAVLYFFLHSLHDRVQGNWPSFIYPALVLLAASVAQERTDASRFTRIVQRFALPVATVILAGCYLQTWTGLLPMGKADPIARMTAVGLQPVAQQISSLAQAEHAAAIVTSRYVTSGWLAFYIRPTLPVLQSRESERWSDAPLASTALLSKPLLYVTQNPDRERKSIVASFTKVDSRGCLPRLWRGMVVDSFCVYSLDGLRNAGIGMHAHLVYRGDGSGSLLAPHGSPETVPKLTLMVGGANKGAPAPVRSRSSDWLCGPRGSAPSCTPAHR